VICCYKNKETYQYSLINDEIQSIRISDQTIYCQYLVTNEFFYMAPAFGGLQIIPIS
jgi:hypothetical protein